MTGPGLRERKKQQTRETIIREALRLFRKRGFDRTTVADIADAADVSPRTFFTYFETKEAVVFHDFEELFERLRAQLDERPPGATTFDALRSWAAALVEGGRLEAKGQLERRKLVASTPALETYESGNRARFERLIAQSVAADLGVAPGELRPRMVSAAAVAALSALGAAETDEIPERPMELVDEAIDFLQAGLAALKRGGPKA
jgi:AcrR family transcriptional regulator